MSDTMPTPTLLQNTQDAVQRGSVSGSQVGPVAQSLALAIATGATAEPTSPLGWQALANQFTQSAAARENLAPVSATAKSATLNPKAMTATSQGAGVKAATPATPAAGNGNGGDLQSFLYGERMAESSNNYTVGEGGAYGMIEPYWQSTATDAGYGAYANQPAGDAPPAVQDAVAAWLAQQNFNKYGSWAHAAQAWYNPATVGQDGYTPPGNVLTMGQYSNRVLSFMAQAPGASAPAATPSTAAAAPSPGQGSGGSAQAINYARQQLGTPYVWGGEQAGVGFDCSGLVQAAFASAGVQLPRVAQDQYNATTKVPAGQEQPGDLLFFGTSTGDITHVGIYLGNNQMIDAPNSTSVVRTEDYTGWGDFVGATRPADNTGVSIQPGASSGPQTGNDGPSRAATLSAYYQVLQHVQSAMTMRGAA